MTRILWRRVNVVGAVIICVGLAVLAARAGDEAESLLKQLEKKYDTINDATVVFSQHVLYGVTKAEQSFTGRFIMRKGNKNCIELKDQTIATDGKYVCPFA